MRKNVFHHVSKQYTTKRRSEKKRENSLRKKLTLNSRISPPGKRYDYLLLFLVFCLWEELFSRFSLLRYIGGLSHPNTHQLDVRFLSLSFFLSFNIQIYIYIYIGEQQKQRAQKLSSTARAHSRCARVVLRLKERKRNTTQNWIPNPKDRERKKKKIASLVSLKHDIC